MAKLITCRHCGATIAKSAKTCPKCGGRNKKPLFLRPWFIALVIIIVLGVAFNGRKGKTNLKDSTPSATRTPTVVSTPKPKATETPKEEPLATEEPEEEVEAETTAEPETTDEPESTPQPETQIPAQTEIRPEVKEYLDSYEEFMDEYIDFMKKYTKADPASAAMMMVDYSRLVTQSMEFSQKIDAMGDGDLTNAEMAYYLEVTNRVNQKLLAELG